MSIAVGISNAVFQYIPSFPNGFVNYLFYIFKFQSGIKVNNQNFFNKNLEKSFNVEIYFKNTLLLNELIKKLENINIIKIISISNVDSEMNLNIQVALKNYNQLDLIKKELDSYKDLNYHINEV